MHVKLRPSSYIRPRIAFKNEIRMSTLIKKSVRSIRNLSCDNLIY